MNFGRSSSRLPTKSTLPSRSGARSPGRTCPGSATASARSWSETGADVARCDVRSIDVDAVTVDALARLQLAARRHGCQVRLRHASSELLELVAFMGLSDVLTD